ncbi:acetolactate synthase large subunit, partial [Candidatus Bipolaricaulota bacterium]|nr:acetolactate synthase large subunit [Candidatus Bipolaricaulota bacterium]
MQRTGAGIVWEVLRREGVEVVFGVPGGAIMPTYDLRATYGIRHVLMRHEQAAAHAADGYARATGRVGVALATSGPGATNLTTGIANAMLDSIPMVCITGQVNVSSLGTDAFQEADITGITLPITKHGYLVTDVNDLGAVLHEAFAIARSGRPGPVLVDLPKDVQIASGTYIPPDTPSTRAEATHLLTEAMLDVSLCQLAAMIGEAERPVVLCGHGVVASRSDRLLLQLAEIADLPTAVTLLGKSAFPEAHPLALGMMGMHGNVAANLAIQQADLVIALGMRFDDRVTGRLD